MFKSHRYKLHVRIGPAYLERHFPSIVAAKTLSYENGVLQALRSMHSDGASFWNSLYGHTQGLAW